MLWDISFLPSRIPSKMGPPYTCEVSPIKGCGVNGDMFTIVPNYKLSVDMSERVASTHVNRPQSYMQSRSLNKFQRHSYNAMVQ
jgi:hypothetical protein